eukprot:gb/GEZN01009072.1/.p1 GENE.gb/GEZN01009072.1/~~gb/GEZN01009072.1/.p1  ORF type:complete len:312 (+),score=51.49 gb/GEZN01009072.1/:46-981(+)
MLVRCCVALFVATGLAWRGLRKRSLSRSGAIAAWLVGAITLACAWRYGVTLLLFYYSSSLLTKYRSKDKAKLEEGVVVGTEGERNARQVFSCSLLAVALCLWNVAVAGSHGMSAGNIGKTDMAGLSDSQHAEQFQRWLVLELAYLSHFAVCAADTWASELGILSSSPPLLITTCRRIPPGTNGGISWLGAMASLLGGAFVGCVFACCAWLEGVALLPMGGRQQALRLVLVGTAAGMLGSLLDSLLGATLQASYQNKTTGQVAGHGLNKEAAHTQQYIHLCGSDILSNEMVNVLSVCLTSPLVGWLAAPLFL